MDFFSILISQPPFSTQIFLVAFLGLVLGSFASLLSHRLSTKQPIVIARSECPKCHTKLKIRNLIPLFSWIFQRGKCGNCKQKISIRYPLIEMTVAISFVIIFLVHKQIDPKFVMLCGIAFTLILMSITDLEHYFIPNIAQYLLAFFIILLRINDAGIYGALNHIQAAFTYMGFGLLMLVFFYITAKIEAIGIDDIKFFFLAGLLLGMDNFLFFMLLIGVLGALFGTIWQKVKHDKTFPFGPPMCLALYICILFGGQINPIDVLGSLIF